MTGNTHRIGASVTVVSYALLTLPQEGNPESMLPLLFMYIGGQVGSVYPDLDHKPDSLPSVDILGQLFSKVLNYIGARHRSWVTHSVMYTAVPLTLLQLLLLPRVEEKSLYYLLFGFCLGVQSHLFLDFLTKRGLRLWKKKYIHLPTRLTVVTGGKGEERLRKVLTVVCVLEMFAYIYTSIV